MGSAGTTARLPNHRESSPTREPDGVRTMHPSLRDIAIVGRSPQQANVRIAQKSAGRLVRISLYAHERHYDLRAACPYLVWVRTRGTDRLRPMRCGERV